MSSIGTGPGISSGPLMEVGAVRPVATADLRQMPAAEPKAATTATAPTSTQAAASPLVTSTARDAGAVPINTDRVKEIRKAIESGTYPIVPAKISDAMIAAGMILRIKP